MKTKLNIRFGGFNYSDHYYNLMNEVACRYGYSDINEMPNKVFDKINWIKEQEKYIKRLTQQLSDYFEVHLKYKRQYEAYSDVIYTETLTVEILPSELLKLRYEIKNIIDPVQFEKFVKVLTTPVDGYIPYYEYNEVMSSNELYTEFALQYLLQHTDFLDCLNM